MAFFSSDMKVWWLFFSSLLDAFLVWNFIRPQNIIFLIRDRNRSKWCIRVLTSLIILKQGTPDCQPPLKLQFQFRPIGVDLECFAIYFFLSHEPQSWFFPSFLFCIIFVVRRRRRQRRDGSSSSLTLSAPFDLNRRQLCSPHVLQFTVASSDVTDLGCVAALSDNICDL